MNYNEIISALREIARNQLRMEKIASKRNVIFSEMNTISDKEKIIQDLKKEIAITNYRTSKLESADPEKTEKTESFNNSIKRCKDDIETYTEDIIECKERIAELEKDIEKWNSGENKVNKEEMESIAKGLIALVTNETARAYATDLKKSTDSKTESN